MIKLYSATTNLYLNSYTLTNKIEISELDE